MVNPYKGINAHLNSMLQNTDGMWESFHAAQIVAWAQFLDQQLPDGYYALPEQSLQISEHALASPRRPRPDVTIFEHSPTHTAPLTSSPSTPTLTKAVIEVFEVVEKKFLTSVMIYDGRSQVPGKPVARLELLSPTNKPQGGGYHQYTEKRQSALDSGVVVVEVDYLHQSPPVTMLFQAYPQRGSVPYMVIVSDPRPNIEQGEADIYTIAVDEALPMVKLPLGDTDVMIFALQSPYDHVLTTTRLYQTIVDYSTVPVQFESYNASDQDRIHQVMQRIQKSEH